MNEFFVLGFPIITTFYCKDKYGKPDVHKTYWNVFCHVIFQIRKYLFFFHYIELVKAHG